MKENLSEGSCFFDKNFQFLSSKTTSVLKNPFKGRILSGAKNSP